MNKLQVLGRGQDGLNVALWVKIAKVVIGHRMEDGRYGAAVAKVDRQLYRAYA